MIKIGKVNRLMAIEEADHGLLLDGGEEHGLILCPWKFLPKEAEPGEEFEVMVYFDSEDRIIATTETPKAYVGDFTCLEVVDVHRKMGAFLDWGLPKDLLLPYAEQITRVSEGDRVVVYIQADKRSNRIIATMKCHNHADSSDPLYDDGQPVSLLIANETPMGYNAIVNNQYLGLLYHSEVQTPIELGDQLEGYIKKIREGGKIDLTLNESGYQRVSGISQDILEALIHSKKGFLPIHDKSSPELIRSKFGVSKRAFKQAIGTLYKERKILIEDNGIRLAD